MLPRDPPHNAMAGRVSDTVLASQGHDADSSGVVLSSHCLHLNLCQPRRGLRFSAHYQLWPLAPWMIIPSGRPVNAPVSRRYVFSVFFRLRLPAQALANLFAQFFRMLLPDPSFGHSASGFWCCLSSKVCKSRLLYLLTRERPSPVGIADLATPLLRARSHLLALARDRQPPASFVRANVRMYAVDRFADIEQFVALRSVCIDPKAFANAISCLLQEMDSWFQAGIRQFLNPTANRVARPTGSHIAMLLKPALQRLLCYTDVARPSISRIAQAIHPVNGCLHTNMFFFQPPVSFLGGQ